MSSSAQSSPVAYLCNEFGIDSDLPTYSGGLGVLAADLISEAADQDFPMVGVGILYKGKEFVQHVTSDGTEEQRDSQFDHDTSFLRQTTIKGKPLIIKLAFDSEEVLIKSYHIRLGEHVVLYFLSTDVDGNPPEWVSDMDALYRGDNNSQIRQQIILGIGGVRLLEALGVSPSIYHINEGRPGFIIWEITKNIMQKEELTFEDAWNKAKHKIVYTNHTLVRAGNLEYPVECVRNWAKHFSDDLGVDVDRLIKDGLINPQTFSITLFALNVSSKRNAVSKVHLENSRNAWSQYDWEYVTNGIYLPRWQDSDYRNTNLSDREIWDLHMSKKIELSKTVLQRTGVAYDPNKLVITWSRRLADYKQPRVIFSDIKRLYDIVQKPGRQVQILFSGNSHSADPNAKNIIEEIIKIMSTVLSGSAIFIPNYNISLANHLTSGSDVWLNTPKGNLEASGTSGMKAISNGVLNCTVLDGWTYEVDWKDIGWVLDKDNIAEDFYTKLENEIAPLYYERNQNGIPEKWIQKMRKSIQISNSFSSGRVLQEYKNKIYGLT
ncbi:MAG: Glycogen/starch/alpha-glucan phosphorylase [Candidatus Woesebacteria bacterium GW2011_GWA1_39_21]|uniref:Glycogen/starch/alpha-glucan phosphorylase n=1 Tax=Candidatus Woesebacteria bacterium GW2011_GWA1_39_21 TaxID=1618550 RepID=A0A0G0NDX9_9BACT|nr:MAG: Glycogen/starch/alpha-glucan phosphorylase [Candidatus Woesebacteria bacterium GW2011_GWA1_39_21]